MSRKVEYMLREWGSFVERHIDWANELGENILHRAGVLSGRVQEGISGHKVLCPDAPLRIRKVDQAVRRLTDAQRDAVVLWYCLPVKMETGKPHTYQELAEYLEIHKDTFKRRLSYARRNLRKSLLS